MKHFIHSPPPCPQGWETPTKQGARPPGPSLAPSCLSPARWESSPVHAPAPAPGKAAAEGGLLCGPRDHERPSTAPSVLSLPARAASFLCGPHSHCRPGELDSSGGLPFLSLSLPLYASISAFVSRACPRPVGPGPASPSCSAQRSCLEEPANCKVNHPTVPLQALGWGWGNSMPNMSP